MARRKLDKWNRVKLGDKDMRSILAEEKLRLASDMVGREFSRDQLVDMLNQGGQQGQPFRQAFINDPRVNQIYQIQNEGKFDRPELQSRNYLGEGQFGIVEELVPNMGDRPGYVTKKQAPLVEFGGYATNPDGSPTPYGMAFGRIHDYRDVGREVEQLNALAKSGISPAAYGFTVNPDGSTEYIMKNLNKNFETKENYMNRLSSLEGKLTPQQESAVSNTASQFMVRDDQQQAMAAMKGLDLQDRHSQNVMRNKMTGRPLQIDPSGRPIVGSEQDGLIAQHSVNAMRSAGLIDEAQIAEGLILDAIGRQDAVALHDLSQQIASRAMKLKGRVPDYQSVANMPIDSIPGQGSMNISLNVPAFQNDVML